MAGPFCDCPRCGGLAVEAATAGAVQAPAQQPPPQHTAQARPPAAHAAPPRPNQAYGAEEADPFAVPDFDPDEFSGMTGATPLTPGLFDGYFEEANQPEPQRPLDPFQQAANRHLETGDIHREPTMLLDSEDPEQMEQVQHHRLPPNAVSPPQHGVHPAQQGRHPHDGASWGSVYDEQQRDAQGYQQDAVVSMPSAVTPEVDPVAFAMQEQVAQQQNPSQFSEMVSGDLPRPPSDLPRPSDYAMDSQSFSIHEEQTYLADQEAEANAQPAAPQQQTPEVAPAAAPEPPRESTFGSMLGSAAAVPMPIELAQAGEEQEASRPGIFDATAVEAEQLRPPPGVEPEETRRASADEVEPSEVVPEQWGEAADPAAEFDARVSEFGAGNGFASNEFASNEFASDEFGPNEFGAGEYADEDEPAGDEDTPASGSAEPGDVALGEAAQEQTESDALEAAGSEQTSNDDDPNLPRPPDSEEVVVRAEVDSTKPFASLLSGQMLVAEQTPAQGGEVSESEFIDEDDDLAQLSDRFAAYDPASSPAADQSGDWVVADPGKPPPLPSRKSKAAEKSAEMPELEAPNETVVARGKGKEKKGKKKKAKGKEKSSEPKLFSGLTLGLMAAAAVVFLLSGVAAGFAVFWTGEKAAPLSGKGKATMLLGTAYQLLHEGSDQEAIEALKEALNNDPTLAEAQRALGTAYGRIGDEESSTKAYQYYVRMAPNAADADEIRRMISQHLGLEEPSE